MTANKGVNNAQNVLLNQGDSAVAAHTQDDVFSVGNVSPPALALTGTQMWFGAGNLPTNYNLTDNGDVQTGLKVHLRQGVDLTPVSSGPNGEQVYSAPAGTQPGVPTRGAWNFDYVVNTAAGVSPTDTFDLTQHPELSAYDEKMQITVSGGSFVTPKTAIFDLNPTAHFWQDEANPSLGFGGGDDFAQPNASAAVMSHIAENSVNPAFIAADFGATLAQMTAAGVSYDVKLATFAANSPHMVSFTHDVINVVPVAA